MAGSHLETGFGRSDISFLNRRRRFKFDGYLERRIAGPVLLFAQIYADTDMGNGGRRDSVLLQASISTRTGCSVARRVS